MYAQKRFVEDELRFQRIKERLPGAYPPFIMNIKDEFDGQDILSGAFERHHNHKRIFLVVLRQSNTIVLQTEKRGIPSDIMKLEANSFSSKKLLEDTIRNYIRNYETL